MEKYFEQAQSDLIKIVFLGPECTGKTTLCKQLSIHYQTVWVPEYSRDYALQKKIATPNQDLQITDVLPIAKGQVALENLYLENANKLLVCDTSLLATKVYAAHYYPEFVNDSLDVAVQNHHYDLCFLTNIDVPWEDDPARDNFQDRQKMFDNFRNTLDQYQKKYILLSGNQLDRFEKAVEMIDDLLRTKG